MYITAKYDGPAPQLFTSTTLYVELTDANDNPPIIEGRSALPISAVITQGSLTGRKVLSVAAFDADQGTNAMISYSLHFETPQNSLNFAINSVTGVITTATTILASPAVYLGTVTASDGLYSATQSINITVTTQNTLAFSGAGIYQTSISESTEVLTNIMAVSATSSVRKTPHALRCNTILCIHPLPA